MSDSGPIQSLCREIVLYCKREYRRKLPGPSSRPARSPPFLKSVLVGDHIERAVFRFAVDPAHIESQYPGGKDLYASHKEHHNQERAPTGDERIGTYDPAD